ncbi:hypothetical protein L2X99_13225 [Microbacterium sp. KUDC0406]|nr:hypothetical protein [Microbacterium sp. KUDC0406]UJP09383.1 hypothetical protein L2X99_13225 [Microbacterium sp. KUDC0406]
MPPPVDLADVRALDEREPEDGRRRLRDELVRREGDERWQERKADRDLREQRRQEEDEQQQHQRRDRPDEPDVDGTDRSEDRIRRHPQIGDDPTHQQARDRADHREDDRVAEPGEDVGMEEVLPHDVPLPVLAPDEEIGQAGDDDRGDDPRDPPRGVPWLRKPVLRRSLGPVLLGLGDGGHQVRTSSH